MYGDGVPRSFDDIRSTHDVWCHAPDAVLGAPHFWELILRTFPAARAYLGRSPRLYSVNAFWTAPGRTPAPALQTWHRDADDGRFVALFVYGTDVPTEDDGSHQYLHGSHAGAGRGVETVFGPAGTAFLADTSGEHYGEKPRRGERLMLWARWGVSERPVAYAIDRTEPVHRAVLGGRYPDDPETRDLIKLVVR